MKKRFLPFSLLLVIMVLAQSLMAGQGQFVNDTRDDNSIYWHSMGPSNMGGRTTSVIFDNQMGKEVYIGTMGGGVFYSWNNGISWHQVGQDLMVSCLAQGSDGTIYVGTGDGCSAVSYNGMADFGYENSFIGSGLYMIKDKEMSPVPSTTANLNEVNEWSFINDIAIAGDKVVVATQTGLRYATASQLASENAVWSYAKAGGEDLTGVVTSVIVASDNTVIAAVDGALYTGTLEAMVCHSAATVSYNENSMIDSLAIAAGMLDIAVAPSDPNVMYAAIIGTAGNHESILLSEDHGATWRVILPLVTATAGHQVYEGRGLFNHGMTVDPENPYSLYVTGYNLWRLDKSANDPQGYYLCVKQSDGNNDIIFSNTYLHSGVNAMTFSPRDSKIAFVATDGGIYKAQINDSFYPTFANCNRGNISARVLSVAPTGTITRVVSGLLDHGPILIEGAEGTNHNGYAVPLYPSNNPGVYGNFADTDHGGSSVASTINPDMFVLVTRDGAIQRTETAGADYDMSNFLGNSGQPTFSYSGYRMPIALWENYNDNISTDSVWFKCKQNQHAGDVVKCYSNTANYPFDYTLPYDMTYNPDSPLLSDSIRVKDPISTKFYVADNGSIYYTMDAVRFNKQTSWYKIATTGGTSSCITLSSDGDEVLVGTRNGRVIRITNMLNAYDAATSTSTDTLNFAPVVTVIELPVDGRGVSSIALSSDKKKMVVTLSGYGQDNYVLFSDNADAETPTFTSKQGDLPLMPVYSSVYEMTTGDVLLGTEHGIYKTENIAASTPNWVNASVNVGDVPVMDLKQQTIYKADQQVPMIVDTVTVMVPYPGTNNHGVIYAATYGKGIFRCENYRQHSGDDVTETPVVANSKVELYPNPVRNAATVRFDLGQNTNVSYQVYDMTGRVVRTENLGNLIEGKHEVNVPMNDMATGAYLLRLNAGSSSSTVKFMVQ